MTGIEKAAELHKRYGPFDYPIDAEDIAKREGLTVITWPLLPPVEEVKVGRSIAVRNGLSSEWRRWNIAHALGHHVLHHGNQLLASSGLQAETRIRSRRICCLFPYAW